MAKTKHEPPQVGDFVKLRGRSAHGMLCKIWPNKWCAVEWIEQGPKIVHLNELEKNADH